MSHFTPADRIRAKSLGVALEALDTSQVVRPISDGVAGILELNTAHLALRAADMEKRSERLASESAAWRTVAIVALTWLAAAGWLIGTRGMWP